MSYDQTDRLLLTRGADKKHDRYLDVIQYKNSNNSKIEKFFSSSKRSVSDLAFFMRKHIRNLTILHDDYKRSEFDKEYHMDFRIAQWFPESNRAREFIFYETMAGMNDHCDCCGVKIHFFNKSPYHLCKTCDAETANTRIHGSKVAQYFGGKGEVELEESAFL